MNSRMLRVIGLELFFILAVAQLRADPTLPSISGATFLVTAYGAVGNGTTDNTAAIQAAITAALAGGGGTVEIPAASAPYLCGPITISGKNLNFQVDTGATLQMLPYNTYPLAGGAYANFISISGSNIALTGAGTIDGQGAAWWAAYNANNNIPHRPYLIKIGNSNIVLLQKLTLKDSPMFHVAFSSTSNVTVDGITITASATSPNTDGIDPAGAHYLIKNCSISTGDDNIAVKPGSTACSDIVITNCSFGVGHGLSIGGQTNLGLDGMTVSNCTFNGTTSGLRLKADATEGGLVQNLSYSNITMTEVQYPIVFYSYYNQVGSPGATSGSSQTTTAKVANWNSSPPDSLSSSTLPVWQNISISNLTATRTSVSSGYSIIWGLPNKYISGITLNNVQLSNYAGFEFYNAQNIQLTGTTSLSGSIITYNAQVITAEPQNQTVNTGSMALFTVGTASTSGASGPITSSYRWNFNGKALSDGVQTDGSTIAGSTTATLSVNNVQSAEVGAYTTTVTTALDGYTTSLVPGGSSVSATSAAGKLNLNGGSAPQITQQPQSAVAVPGQTINFTAAATGATGYRWLFNGTALSDGNGVYGSATLSLTFTNAQAANAGSYTLVATNGAGSSTSSAAVLTINPSVTAGQLTALSVRSNVTPGAGTLIVGFAIGGSGTKPLLIRGIGPGLTQFSLTGLLNDPLLQVYTISTNTIVASNDNWLGSTSISNAAAQVGSFALTDPNSLDAALLTSLAPGGYTANVSGNGNTSGIALAEVYDTNTTNASQLLAVSARSPVATGSGSLIAGFVIGGSASKTVLIRATGPGLTQFGVMGVLADPLLQVYNLSTKAIVASNDNWGGDSTIATLGATVGAYPLTDPASLDAALIVTLPPGNYTANVTGVNNASGVALVEVYDLK